MNIFGQRNPRIRRGITLAGLVMLLGVVVLALTQCRQVTDSVTGVDLRSASTASAKSKCKKHCDEDYKKAKKDEDQRHKDAKRKCESDKDCKKKEDQIHKDNAQTIKTDKQKCKNSCYNEGSGKGGR
jgi:hypothetical protein